MGCEVKARAALAALLVVATCGLAVGCNPPHDTISGDDAAVVDVDLLAFLSMARARHHEANLDESSGDLDGAIAALGQLVAAPRPHPDEKVPEVEEVLADTYARMADLRLKKNDVSGASKDVQAGLEHATEPTYFRGHLLEVYGIVEEARTAELADAGKSDEAEKAKAHAKQLLRQAVDIQERVIGKTLGDGGAE